MAKKEQPTNVNNNTNIVNVNLPDTEKQNNKKPNWVVKAIVLALISLITSIILIYVQHSTAENGKPAFIQNGTPAEPSK